MFITFSALVKVHEMQVFNHCPTLLHSKGGELREDHEMSKTEDSAHGSL